MDLSEQLREIIEPAVREIGLQLWGVEYHGGRHSGGVLRVFIDAEQGVDVEDCARASRWLSELLDVEWPESGSYRLEISSPGLDRPLYTLEQYRLFVGENLQLQLRTPRAGRRNFKGRLAAVRDPGTLVLDCEDAQHDFPYEQVARGRLAPEF